jgi:hypothetical protein
MTDVILNNFRKGMVIPAMPLALNEKREFQPRYQRAMARYYIDAGAGGVAVGVHSTQFEIREPEIGLFEPVLRQTAGFIDEWSARRGKPVMKVGGICGPTAQALKEAEFERSLGYDAGLLSLAALKNASIDEMLAHCRKVSEIIPVIGFYLQPSVGGRILPYEFWREFATIKNVIGIKMAPFNRYQTFDVVRALAESGREDITLYTGNDDNIVIDLLSEYQINDRKLRIKGGLLGHWCCWTRKAVELLEECHRIVDAGGTVSAEMLTRNIQVTDCNAAFFDPAHQFAGCIPGIHEVLRRQGLLPGTWCLNPNEVLSPGQSEEIDRVWRAYPHLNDDGFINTHRNEWFED